jgi:hypothetical protein
MRLTTQLDIPIEVQIIGKSVFKEDIKIGKITNSYVKDNKLWAVITLDSKKLKQFKQLLKDLKQLKDK